ncbi:hypothetical protein VaNZ11_012457 [Volvox africanus]|uniref:SBP-type domain-containing protein n=1 Tax=Volvox africanus TaxID=51714 RepID=A0ABQ5SFE3_9CHLO|nr:hypothetical protein VaNZ11_012457 [Volvox africanus]
MPPLLIHRDCYLVCKLLEINSHPPACAPVGPSLKLDFGSQDEYQTSGRQAHLKEHQQSPQERATMKSTRIGIKPTKEERCQVDGCMADLSGLRPYFRRYHVCETHIRSQVVSIKNHKVRFCDQCSTFHPISQFDGGRRTCRQKLEHNRQRRRARRSQSARNELDAKQEVTAACALESGGSLKTDDCNVTIRLATSEVCSAASVHDEDAQGMHLQLVDRAPAHVTSSGPWRSGFYQPVDGVCSSTACLDGVHGVHLHLVNADSTPVTPRVRWPNGFSHVDVL